MKIQNSRILITGANRGIGRAFAELIAQDNTILYVVNRKQDLELEQRLKQLGATEVHSIACDLNIPNELNQLLNKIPELEIDILFNNAGVLTGELLENQKLESIETLLQVNVYALIALTKAVLPQMLLKKSGKIINQASVAGIMHFPCSTTYSASKAAVIAFTQALELELKNTGVSTLCLITPAIDTDMLSDVHTKFGRHLKLPKLSMPAKTYAKKIRHAILADKTKLLPLGLEWFGVFFATYFPKMFQFVVSSLFNRK